MEVRFEDLKKYFPVELERYSRNYGIEASRIKSPFNAWAAKVVKCQTRSIRSLYRVRYIDMGYNLEIARRDKKKVLEDKSKMPRAFKLNM